MPGSPDTCWSVCGDGRTVNLEKCDDGNGNNNGQNLATDGCANCAVVIGWYCWRSSQYTASNCYEICGDGLDYQKYGCDDGNLKDDDGCDSFCRVEIGYTCVGGNPFGPDTCTEICGDGKDFYNYKCDDGNLVNGDGCSSTCNIEVGWDCGYGNPRYQDFCWPLQRPMIIDAAVSSDNMVMLVTLNRTILCNRKKTYDDYHYCSHNANGC
jgi:cysteine-rich repeat protein